MEGGGACWDEETCGQGLGKAVYEGSRDGEYSDFVNGRGRKGIYNRTNPRNPFRAMHYVHVPYCTGDIHGGTRAEASTYDVVHAGYNNIGHFLARVVPTFPSVEHVFVVGMSAGGFGANINFDRITKAFEPIPTHLLIDSAPPFDTDVQDGAVFEAQTEAWGLNETLPSACLDDGQPTCTTLKDLLFSHFEAHPSARVGLISSNADSVLRFFLGRDDGAWPFLPEEDYAAAVEKLRGEIESQPMARMFVAEGSQHIFIHDEPLGDATRDGEASLLTWLFDFVDGGRWDQNQR